ncbi:hypothetical protein HELRODRAFT_194408 [Helobdella robusta]|uniref:BAAT/Acyl-CoA thioester hydrolase C-terminal domain-containing protein n=1 Tax=Helobdella robusta TaxID=6412 RepID=T1FW09_HELRO|nr:hypothetical protein HELRODRAFT_194408 [Helobdella robusta]ESN92160.1 hypothetical protein HELRODRAFT_194408 [Helobdella robusta]
MSNDKPVSLNVCPVSTLMDEVCEITCRNLEPHKSTSLLAIIHNDEDATSFYSLGTFVSDLRGEIDVNRSFSYSGTYTGTESMGLFWSAIPAPDQKGGSRLIKRVVDVSLDWNLFLIDGCADEEDVMVVVNHVKRCRARQKKEKVTSGNERASTNDGPNSEHLLINDVTLPDNKRVLARAISKRYYCYPSDVTQTAIRDGRVRGIVFSLKNKEHESKSKAFGERKGIIEVYGGGSFKLYKAALLAQRGFVVFALAYCDYEDLPRREINTTVDYFIEAVEYMLSNRFPIRFDVKCGIGLIGLCKGATLLLELAAVNPQNAIRCVVAVNAPCFNSIGSFTRAGSTENIAHVWNMKDPLLQKTNIGVISDGLLEWFLRKDPSEQERIGIPVERIDAEILFVFGVDDVSIGVRNMEYMVERMRKRGKDNYKCLVYPGAGHIIDPPIFPLCHASYWPMFGDVFVWGGLPKLHHDAQVDSWKRIIEFFKIHLC